MSTINLLAETRVTDLSQRYQEATAPDDGLSATAIAVGLLIALAIVAGVILLLRRPAFFEHTPTGLLEELCRARGIGSSGYRLMSEIAERAGVQHPGVMFVSAEQFDAVIERAAIKGDIETRQKKDLGFLRRRLFDSAA